MPRRTFLQTRKFVQTALGILIVAPGVLTLSGVGGDDALRRVSARIPDPLRRLEGQIFDPSGPREVPVPRPAVSTGRVAATAARGIVTRGEYTSIQVNVDEAGNDIIGDAANEPTIAVDPIQPSRMAIAWRQFDTINSNFREAGMGHTTDSGATWTAGKIDPGQFRSDPVLSFDRHGNFFFSSLSSTISVELFRSSDGGATWLGPVDAYGGDKQWMTVDRTTGTGSGNIYQIWNSQFSCCGLTDFARSVDSGMSFQFPLSLPLPKIKWGMVDVGPDGTVYMAGSNLNGTAHHFLSSSNARDRTVIPTFSAVATINLGGNTTSGGDPNPAGLLGQVSIATNHAPGPRNGEIYVLGSVDPPGIDPLDVMFIRSTDGGKSWSTPLRINDDDLSTHGYQWFGTMAVAPSGRIDVVWNDTRNDIGIDESELYHSYSIDGGVTWSANEPLTPPFNHYLGYPSQNKMGDYYHMVSDARGAHLAFAATFNGGQDVYYLHIPGDCNLNGVDDATDIANMTSPDCTGNGLPDECEPDCNGNGNADSCDILSGVSTDCTANGLPDDCESDCNANGEADSCEIQAGTAADENGNGLPDSCEAILYVRKDANGKHTGLSWADAYTNLQPALAHASGQVQVVSQIWVAAGTYTHSAGDRAKSFQLIDGVEIYGGFAGNETALAQRNWKRNPTILSGDLLGNDFAPFGGRDDNSYHVVRCDSCGTPVLDGFIIRGGQADGTGEHQNGAGMLIYGSAPRIAHCSVLDNQSNSQGGGVHASFAQPQFHDCLIEGNAAFEGAGIYLSRSAQASIRQCTVAANAATGLAGIAGDYGGTLLESHGSIIWGNTDFSGSIEDAQITGLGSVNIDYSTVEGWSGQYGGEGNSGADPMFADVDGADDIPGTLDDDFRLAAASPAINAGPLSEAGLSAADLEGHARVLCGRVDQGAYEFGIGDYDCNGVVNLADVVLLPPCLLGPMMQLEDTCEAFDFDADSDVDLIDYGLLQTSLTE